MPGPALSDFKRDWAEVDVLHLVGTAIENQLTLEAADFRFDDPFAVQSNVDTREPAPSSTARMLRLGFPRARLYLAHASPAPAGTPPRTLTTRLSAMTARRFAGELAEGGVAVVWIPPLATLESEAAAGQLLAALRSSVVTASDLANAVAALRTRLAKEVDVETALDVCVYAPTNWHCPFASRSP